MPAVLALAATLLLSGCYREPALRFPDDNVTARMHIDLVTDTTLRTPYTVYPEPTYYEFRHFIHVGDSAERTVESTTVFTSSFNRTADEGIHRLLAWSDIDSKDGTQVLTVNEESGRATASTTVDPDGFGMTRSAATDSMGMTSIRHAPEMFYGGQTDSIAVGTLSAYSDFEDYADTIEDVNAVVRLRPLVYCVRLEIVILGNDGRIVGTPGQTLLTSMAQSVDIATGRTLHEPCGVFFYSTMTRNPNTEPEGKVTNDTITGSLTTFGLCDMNPYSGKSQNIFEGGRDDLRNYLFFTMTFNNGVSKTYRTDVTDIMRNYIGNGLIRVTINAADFPIPDNPDPHHGGGGTEFKPTVNDYNDVVHEFDM